MRIPRLSHIAPKVHGLCCASLVSCLVMAACGTGAAVHASTPTGLAPALKDRNPSILEEEWAGYKTAFIEPDGRVIDPARGGVTTSEGQGYALLRAVWMGDQPAFDTVWHWTATNLETRDDGLFASLWSGGKVADANSASDADSDIALAVLDAIWQGEVVSIKRMNVLTAGNWAKTQVAPGPVINPSYFAPYAYRTFAREDPGHPWGTLIDSSYAVLGQCTDATLGGAQSVGLPPNWCAISRSTGAIVPFPTIAGADDYGYDAFRVMWRVALDALWNHEARARAYLARSAFLRTQWNSNRALDAVYAHDGTAVSSYDDPTLYGGDIGNFLVTDPAGAAQIEQELLASFHPPASATSATAYFGDSQNYFEQNWVWFGLALSSGVLVDLDRAGS